MEYIIDNIFVIGLWCFVSKYIWKKWKLYEDL